MTIEEAEQHIGAEVLYRPYPGAPVEEGEIASVSKSYVFVQFTGDRHRKACRPADLQLPVLPVLS
jgi:hypothetical protein